MIKEQIDLMQEKNHRIEALEEEALDRAIFEKMRDASIEKFILQFGKGAVISESEFLL